MANTKQNITSPKRQRLYKMVQEINALLAQRMANRIGTRQAPVDEDPFSPSLYSKIGKDVVLVPPYSFEKLYEYYESSDILQTCIIAMATNVDGFGHLFEFTGDDATQKDLPEAKKNLVYLQDFFSQVNDRESFRKIRKEMRKDYEIIGNGAFEFIRDFSGNLSMIYNMKFKNMRLIKVDSRPQRISVRIRRGGVYTTIDTFRYFRRYVQLSPSGATVRWFKELGDPRVLNAVTGEYYNPKKKDTKPPRLEATEVLHFRNQIGTEAYGIPRWIGSLLGVAGRTGAQYVNYDLFETQGIPPLFITVSGGQLTDDSFDYLENLLRSLRGTENFNRVTLLEAFSQSYGLDDKPGTAKIEIVDVGKFRKEDLMFKGYLSMTKEDIRHNYRLPDLYIGASEAYTHSTSRSSQVVAEAQVFDPERTDFDETTNTRVIVQEMKIDDWRIKSKGPRIVGADEIATAIDSFGKQGAFTINSIIRQANESFATQMSEFSGDWAKYPLPIVTELIKNNRLVIPELEQEAINQNMKQLQKLKAELSEKTVDKATKITGILNIDPGILEMVDKTSLGEHEKSLYLLLLQLSSLLHEE